MAVGSGAEVLLLDASRCSLGVGVGIGWRDRATERFSDMQKRRRIEPRVGPIWRCNLALPILVGLGGVRVGEIAQKRIGSHSRSHQNHNAITFGTSEKRGKRKRKGEKTGRRPAPRAKEDSLCPLPSRPHSDRRRPEIKLE